MAVSIEDLQKQLLDLQTKYDTLSDTVKQKDELLEGFKNKEMEHIEKATKYQEQIMKLRDMNTELFLKVSQPIPTETPEVLKEPEVKQEETISLEDILG